MAKRCSQCGSVFPDNITLCDKCNILLKKQSISNDSEPISKKSKLTKTVKGEKSSLLAIDYRNDQNSPNSEVQKCPNCDYQMRKNSHICPNCQFDITANSSKRKLSSKSIDPYRQPKQSKCFLEPVLRANEKNKKTIELEGSIIILNRENLEPENNTISSKEQAMLEFKNGTWFLINKSQLQTTFKLVTKPVELKDEDLILIGDRKFIFKL